MKEDILIENSSKNMQQKSGVGVGNNSKTIKWNVHMNQCSCGLLHYNNI